MADDSARVEDDGTVFTARERQGLFGKSNDDVSVNRLAFRYVFVPWDASCAMEQKVMVIPREREMECLLDYLRDHFRRRGAIDGAHARDVGKQKEILKAQLEGERGAEAKTYSDEMMEKALDMQMAQPVALLPGSKKTGFVHVNMYVDDRGISKGLPVNERASLLAAAAGSPQRVMGDAFIARIFDDDNDFKRLDFTIDECSSDAAWMKRAKSLALEREASIGDVQATMAELSGKGAVDLSAGALSARDTSGTSASAMKDLPEHLRPGPHQDFEWTQDEDEVTLKVRVPAGTSKADVSCVFGPGSQKMSLKIATLGDVPGKSMRVIDNEGDVDLLFQEIIPDECSWSLVTDAGERAFEASLPKRRPDERWATFLRRGGPPETPSS